MAYRFLIEPTKEQAVMFSKTFGCCRYLWNHMLSDKKEHYTNFGKTLDVTPAAYKKLEESKWLNEVDSIALCNVQLNMDAAYSAFFKGNAQFPKFKKKGHHDSYTTNCVNGNIKLNGNRLCLPKVPGLIKIKVHRKIEDGGTLKSVTVVKEPDGKYYASILFEYPKTEIKSRDDETNSIGIDMKLRGLYVTSDGEEANYPNFYRQAEDKLAREQKRLSRKKKGSKNFDKQRKKVAKAHAKIKHQRKDFLHKQSRSLADKYDYVFIEDLDMRDMAQGSYHGKSVCDVGWSEFVNMLTYKMANNGGHVVKIDKWFASSKTCHECGHVYHELSEKERTFVCPHCGHVIDRDYQAALNIKEEGLRTLSAA